MIKLKSEYITARNVAEKCKGRSGKYRIIGRLATEQARLCKRVLSTMEKAVKIGAVLMFVYIAGCSTTNGLCRDVRSVAEFGIEKTQGYVDRQRENSIAFGISERNRIMQQGREVYSSLMSE